MTFDTVETADDAVAQFNGTTVGSVSLEVEIARKQKGSFRNRMNYDKNNPEVCHLIQLYLCSNLNEQLISLIAHSVKYLWENRLY